MRWLKSKKGAVNPALLLSMLLSAALIIILLIQIFNFAVLGSVKGNAGYIARDAGSLIEVSYSAPETLKAAYKVPFGSDGYPKAGSLLLDGKRNRICVSPHSEDEMYGLISETAMAGFAGAVATKGVVKYRKRIWQGISWIGKKIPGVKIVAGAIKIVSKRITTRIASSKISKKLSQYTFKAISAKGTEVASRTYLHGAALLKKGAPRIADATGRHSSTVAGLMYLENYVFCPPTGWPCGKLIAYAIVIGAWALDHIWTTLPLIMLIRWGHDASNRELDEIKCYSITTDITTDKFHAEPANCKTKVENVELKSMLEGLPLLEVMPGSVPLSPSCEDNIANLDEQGGIKSESDFCYSCPNYFVSQPDAEINTLSITIPGTDALGEGINIYPQTAIVVGPKVACSLFMLTIPPQAWKGAACSAGYYAGLITLFYTNPAWVINFFTGSNILPRDEYYYMAFPSRIDVEKTYNADGTSELSIVHAE